MTRISRRVNGNGRPLRQLRYSTPNLITKRRSALVPRPQVELQNVSSSESEDESESDSVRSNDESSQELEETASFIITDLTFLDCPICCESLDSPVYQCENGHVACAPCCTKMENNCPSCRCSIGTIRCRVLEMVIESFTVACKNKLYGCMQTFIHNKKVDKLEHEMKCFYSPCTCPNHNCS